MDVIKVLFWLRVTRMSRNGIALSCSNSMVNFILLWQSAVLTCYIPKNSSQVNKIRFTAPGSFESSPSRAACRLLCKDRKQNWISGIQVIYFIWTYLSGPCPILGVQLVRKQVQEGLEEKTREELGRSKKVLSLSRLPTVPYISLAVFSALSQLTTQLEH